MFKICLHWTAGGPNPNAVDLRHYHYVVDARGEVHDGQFVPEDNIPPLLPGQYAMHCGGGNSNRIGVALCGGPKDYKVNGKLAEITRLSWEAALYHIAELCLDYDIPVDWEHVHTHHEFGLANPRTSSRGKPDINALPWKTNDERTVGDQMRASVRWYKRKIEQERELAQAEPINSPIPDDGSQDEVA
jgi:hypothetical protein